MSAFVLTLIPWKVVNVDSLEGALNIKFKDKGLLVHAITHATLQSSGVSSYELA